MVTSVTNLSRSGLYDWMAQRVSAVVLAAYFIFFIWHTFFSSPEMFICMLTLQERFNV